jgi:hypothetical protein
MYKNMYHYHFEYKREIREISDRKFHTFVKKGKAIPVTGREGP